MSGTRVRRLGILGDDVRGWCLGEDAVGAAPRGSLPLPLGQCASRPSRLTCVRRSTTSFSDLGIPSAYSWNLMVPVNTA